MLPMLELRSGTQTQIKDCYLKDFKEVKLFSIDLLKNNKISYSIECFSLEIFRFFFRKIIITIYFPKIITYGGILVSLFKLIF